jgi:cation transport ATPase
MPGDENKVSNAEKQERSLVRMRLVLVLVALVVPGALYGLFARQARRLDALGARGEVMQATATGVSRQYVNYAYAVDGVTYTWNVGRNELPEAVVGDAFPIVYSPEDPALSRPGTDRAKAATEAASNRTFARRAVAGVFAFFALTAVTCEVSLRRLRRKSQSGVAQPQEYRTRLLLAGVTLVPLLVLVFGWHLGESLRRDGSVWPAVLGMVVALSVLGGTALYVLREGRTQAAARAARVLRWAAPVAIAIAALRLLGWLLGWHE